MAQVARMANTVQEWGKTSKIGGQILARMATEATKGEDWASMGKKRKSED